MTGRTVNAWAAVGCAMLALAAGCSRADGEATPAPTVCAPFEGGTPVAPELLAFLSRARSAHHAADLHEENKNPEKAVAVLRKIVDEPAFSSPPIEAREVFADTHARIADLESQSERFDPADESIDAGLEMAREVTFFRGHLYEIKGLVEERRAASLRKNGNEAAANVSTERALEAFEQSMDIQARVIKNALADAGGPP